jgi:hypothetical protein
MFICGPLADRENGGCKCSRKVKTLKATLRQQMRKFIVKSFNKQKNHYEQLIANKVCSKKKKGCKVPKKPKAPSLTYVEGRVTVQWKKTGKTFRLEL